MENKIFAEHRKLQGMTELNAKFRYVQLCRSLKTYGVTFFVVKEKVPKKNKMIDILLGVTRDSVMRLDADTKVHGGERAGAGVPPPPLWRWRTGQTANTRQGDVPAAGPAARDGRPISTCLRLPFLSRSHRTCSRSGR